MPANRKLCIEFTFCLCDFFSSKLPHMLCSERVGGSSVKKGTYWENSPFNVFWDAKHVLFSFLKLLSADQKQFAEKKKTVVEKLLLCFSLLHLHGKGLLPTTAGPLTWRWLSNVSLGGALHAGGVLFCGHFNHMVEAIIRIRPDRATQVLLPGLSWSGNLCQPPVETPRLQQAAHTSWLPQECWKYSNNQYRSLWHSRVAKEARIYRPKPKAAGRETAWEELPTMQRMNNSAALVRDQPDQVSPASLGQAAIAIIHSTVWARSFPAPSYHSTWFLQF